jgi:uncharacterized protein (TIGR02996 family)
MTDGAALLAAVAADPDEDTPRLAYADWLDEHGDPARAEFVRLQIERAREAARRGAPEADLSAREQALLDRHEEEWFGLPPGREEGWDYVVRRGFPCAVFGGYENFCDHQDALARWPVTRLHAGVYLHDADHARRLGGAPLLARIRELDLYYSHAGPEVVCPLLRAPALAGLLWLNVGYCRLGDEGAAFLATQPCLPRLRHLDLNGNSITAAGIRELIGSEHRGSVESLSLAGNGVAPADVRALLGSDRWPRLTDLCLWNLGLGDTGVADLAGCPDLARLTALNLNHNGLTDAGVWALAASPYVRNLRTLALSANALTSACVDVLIGSPNLGGLKFLRLTHNKIQWRRRRKLEGHFGPGVSFELL